MTTYKLIYFNLRARGELIRWLFSVAGQKFEDVRFERADWPKYKPNAPFGQVPYLEIHDGSNVTRLPQSNTIARYLARKFNLAGKNELEQALAEAYGDQLNDIFAEYAKVFRESDPVKKSEIEKKIYLEIWPNTLKVFEESIAKNNGWLVGDKMTWTDLYLTVVLERLGKKRDLILANYPKCKALAEKVNTNPKIAEWIKKRPATSI